MEKKIKILKKNCNQSRNLLFSGKIKIFNNGYAFVTLDSSNKEIFIPKNKTGYALINDKVQIKLYYKNNRKEGKVIKVIKREKKTIIGIVYLKTKLNSNLFIVKSIYLHVDIHINNLKNAKNGDKVIVKFIDWPTEYSNPIGEIIKVLGVAGTPNVERNAILIQYNINYKFTKKILREAEKMSSYIPSNEIKKRRDMRNIITFTIDPLDAKDFDDAISFRYIDDDIMEIGVHIADVSYYVKKNSLLDKEAYDRSTSIYLYNNVIPMLPDVISNDLCSLKPNHDRLAFSVIFKINKNAKIVNTWFGKTIIFSKKRFTYEEVQKIIEIKKGCFSKEILTLNKLSKKLKKERIKNGAINFNSAEIKFQFDNYGIPINFDIKYPNESHFLIEEFMLLANKKVSEFVSLNNNGKNLFIYRIHDKPNLEKLTQLKIIIHKLGYDLNITNEKKIPQSLNKLLNSAKGTPEQTIIDSLVMRTMNKAYYSYKNIGHYGLAFSYYSHFTSPIRRYPDIIAHRLLENCLLGNNLSISDNNEKYSDHFSKRERTAIEVEREYIRFTQIIYMKSFIGSLLEGIISCITDWNIYIEIITMKIDGMIRIRDITDDKYIFNQKNCLLTGKKYGKIYHIGQRVNIKIININIEKKYIELQLIN